MPNPLQDMFIPPEEKIPFLHKGHRYQVWTNMDLGWKSSPMPYLLVEYTAPNDKKAKDLLIHVLSAKYGSYDKAKAFLQMHHDDTTLRNIDTMEELKFRKPEVTKHTKWNLFHIMFDD